MMKNVALTLNHLQDDNCMQLLFLPFHKWSLRSTVRLSQRCQRRSLILAHLAVCFIRLKETPHCRLSFPLTGKVFCCTKACVSRTAPYADQCELRSRYHRYCCSSLFHVLRWCSHFGLLWAVAKTTVLCLTCQEVKHTQLFLKWGSLFM